MGVKAQLNNARINAAVFQITTEDELVVRRSMGGRTSYKCPVTHCAAASNWVLKAN